MRVHGTRLALVAAVALSMPAAVPAAPERPAVSRVRVGSLRSVGAVERALVGARRRLARPGCERILHEFRDREGRPLSEELRALGATAEAHLGTLFFYDGGERPTCQAATRPLAFTHVGSRVVYVCPSFADLERKDPVLAEAALIHESLHTLGLGENPPTSSAITARVMAACRR